VNRYCQLSVAKGVLIALLATSLPISAKRLVIEGDARFVDGKPIPIGTIYVQELQHRKGDMPASRMLTLGTTSLDGTFELVIDDVKGDLFVALIGDHCSWLGAQELISRKELDMLEDRRLTLSAERELCDKYP